MECRSIFMIRSQQELRVICCWQKKLFIKEKSDYGRERNGLGKGLDSLIPNKTVKEESASQQKVSKEKQEKNVGSGEILVKINEVEPNREQPRKEFDEDSLMELADSIRQFGILQPLLVQKKKDYYEIIAGERRWRAAKLAGIKDVPIIVKNYTDQEIVEISLIENIQRENLNPSRKQWHINVC